jgi:RNA-directed DNA polymerase
MKSRELNSVLADSPKGGKGVSPTDVSAGKTYLLRIAESRNTKDFIAATEDPSHLLERVVSAPNLAQALLNVARNRGAAGVDGVSVDEVVGRAPILLPQLQQRLLQGKYTPGDIRRVWIPKPGGQRGLGIPTVIDRWVQQALLEVLQPIFEPGFHPSSHGFRPERGAHTAIPEAQKHIETGYQFVVDIDLAKFFDRVNHQRLLSRLETQISDRRILRLIAGMLKAQVVMPDGTKVTTEEGTPQGGPLSPLLSNIVLDELDWELERRGHRFVRYADDCKIYVRSERAGHRVMKSISRFIIRRLRWVINEEKSSVCRPDHNHFLGFRLSPQPEGNVTIHLSARSKTRVDEKIRQLTPRTWGQSLESCFERINKYLRGWMAYFRICTFEEMEMFHRLDAHIRRRIRAIILHQKKRARSLYRHLLARRVPESIAAGTAFSRRGIWRRSNYPGLTKAYPNKWFSQYLVSLEETWRQWNPATLASGQQLLFEL